jgi:hypothetical protein
VGLRYDIEVLASISKFLTCLRYRVHNFDIEVLRYWVQYSTPVHFDIEAFKLRYRPISKCFDIGYDIQSRCSYIEVFKYRYRSTYTSISKLLDFDTRYRSMQPRYRRKPTSISKFFGSFDIEVLNNDTKCWTSIRSNFDIEVLRSTSISKHTSI